MLYITHLIRMDCYTVEYRYKSSWCVLYKHLKLGSNISLYPYIKFRAFILLYIPSLVSEWSLVAPLSKK